MKILTRSILALILINCSFTLKASDPLKLAVYHFTGERYYYHDYARSVRDGVEAGFVNSNRFVMVERTKFNQLNEENQFMELNTQEAVQIGQNIGANLVVLGHVSGVTSASETKSHIVVVNGDQYYTEHTGKITINLKIVDVTSSQIIISETINVTKETRTSQQVAIQKALEAIPSRIRSFINKHFPQEFKFMEISEIDDRKDAVKEFKMWAGGNQGLHLGDVVTVLKRSFVENPYTGEKVANNDSFGDAEIVVINSGDISTLRFLNWRREGNNLKKELESNQENIVLQFTGKRN